MKSLTKRKTITLLCSGIFIISIAQLVTHFSLINDFVKGAAFGVGIGVLVIALISGNFKTQTKSSN